MRVLWRIERGTVEEVRKALPKRARGAYTTVQTVLNRLADRGLLSRERVGNVIVYAPRIDEADYLARSLRQTLTGATEEARRSALASLVGGLESGELDEIRRLAKQVAAKRQA